MTEQTPEAKQDCWQMCAMAQKAGAGYQGTAVYRNTASEVQMETCLKKKLNVSNVEVQNSDEQRGCCSPSDKSIVFT